tara:strand:- start:83 stop:577 length:495 start_codon:yes stop_codon:yes gene_type:complete
MAELRATFASLSGNAEAKLENIITLLNSGNVIFQTEATDIDLLETTISETLEKSFGFPIPTRVRSTKMLMELLASDPFKNIIITKDIRCYISFLKDDTPSEVEIPWTSEDQSFTILQVNQKTIVSVLDLAITNTPKAMGALEKTYGKDITTRNWNTLKRIEAKL